MSLRVQKVSPQLHESSDFTPYPKDFPSFLRHDKKKSPERSGHEMLVMLSHQGMDIQLEEKGFTVNLGKRAIAFAGDEKSF